jgi:hypothetical protein
VFTSNRQALEALEQEDSSLASKVYALAKRQASNGTMPTTSSSPPSTSQLPPPTSSAAPPPTTSSGSQTSPPQTSSSPEPTTPFLTTMTSSFESVITTNGVRSTITEVTVVVATETPSPIGGQTQTVNPQLQSLGVKTADRMGILLLLVFSFSLGSLWMFR